MKSYKNHFMRNRPRWVSPAQQIETEYLDKEDHPTLTYGGTHAVEYYFTGSVLRLAGTIFALQWGTVFHFFKRLLLSMWQPHPPLHGLSLFLIAPLKRSTVEMATIPMAIIL
jgi:hypothetical protein